MLTKIIAGFAILLLGAGYCMTCYNFVCECEGQYD